jgi:hypothetical protein
MEQILDSGDPCHLAAKNFSFVSSDSSFLENPSFFQWRVISECGSRPERGPLNTGAGAEYRHDVESRLSACGVQFGDVKEDVHSLETLIKAADFIVGETISSTSELFLVISHV